MEEILGAEVNVASSYVPQSEGIQFCRHHWTPTVHRAVALSSAC